jgi:glycosyltransferase involved in cell wall biosynthesis
LKRIALLHYASAPTIGGVESLMTHHARALDRLGYAVTVVSGDGAQFDERIPVQIDPIFSSQHPDVLALKRDLDAGTVPPAFEALTGRMETALREALAGCDVVIVHNAHTLNKHLALTVALSRMSQPRQIAYVHDIAWTNPQYQPELHDRYPWTLLRQPLPDVPYITVSEARCEELARVLGVPRESITLMTPGIDPMRFLGWTPLLAEIDARLHLLDADGLLLLPARLTRRKNIALGLHVLAALREQSGRDMRLIVTGPPGAHNPTNRGYFGELLDLRASLGLADSAHFLYELFDPPRPADDDTMAALFRTCDALLFPSTQEGFGIPVLEAGLAGLPVFCSDILPFRETGRGDVTFFDPDHADPRAIAADITDMLDHNPAARLRVRVRQQYRWDTLVRDLLVPHLEAP